MAKMPWLKLYTEILDDPKLAGWTGDQFRVFVYLLCLAREAEEPGFIPMTPAEISWRIRRLIEEVESTIAICQQGDRPIITAVEGGYQVDKFLDRQYDKPSDKPEATRARKQKQRDKENESRECHADVTPCHAIDKIREDKIRVDKDQEKEKHMSSPSGSARPKKQKADYSPEFLAVYEMWPRKDDKKDAFKAYNARLKESISHEQIYLAASNYIAQVDDPQFCKMLKTFLGPGEHIKHWLDPPEAVRPQKLSKAAASILSYMGGDPD